MSGTSYDPISVEIHRKALDNIATEMAITLTRTSGSPVVYEVQDFATCLMDLDGEHLSMSATVLIHAGSSLLGTRAIIDSLGDDDQVRPGDGWIVNDPFEGGAQHQGDVAIIMPQFFRDEHIGWSFANVHVADIGGMGIGGFAPSAVSVYDEGIRFPATRIMSEGVIEREWERYIRANVRVADLVLNDLRSMIAANNVAQQKLIDVVERTGLETYREYCEINKGLTEQTFRARIAKLPDGVYETLEWIEFDGHGEDLLLEMRVTMEIDGSDMRLRFSGPDQVDAFVNGTAGTIYGGVMTAILTVLGYGDLPFNAGIWRPVEIDLGPAGSAVNAQPPAPVTAGHSFAGLRTTRAVKDLLNQACALSDDAVVRGRIGGLAAEGVGLTPLSGLGRGGAPTVMFLMDNVTGNGGGAQTVADGLDCYGVTLSPGVGLPSIETNEALQPTLYVWRRLALNSGGPGYYRGGQGLEAGFSIMGTQRLDGAVTVGTSQAPGRGVGGGLTASAGLWQGVHDTNLAALHAEGRQATEERLTGERPERPASFGRLSLREHDVMRVRGGGGGGIGDPLLRPAEAVVADVRDQYISVKAARAAYGVVVDDALELDPAATAELRKARRAERIGGTPTARQEPPETPGISVLLDRDSHRWQCGYCRSSLGSADGNWRELAATRESDMVERFAELDMYVRRHRGDHPVVMAEHHCPACGGLLVAEYYPKGSGGFKSPRLASVPATA